VATIQEIVSLCISVEEGKVEELLDGLIKVVESEGRMVEIKRIRNFLHKVDKIENSSSQFY